MTQHSEIQCPRCSSSSVEKIGKCSALSIGWMLEDGLALGEFLFGLPQPAETYFCKACDPHGVREWAHCSSCQNDLPSRLWLGWSVRIGNWFGLFCPHCAAKIPILWSIWRLILAVVFLPLWLPVWICFRKKIISWEQKRSRKRLQLDEVKSRNTPPLLP